ncbi:MAG: endolytic transglycosylase MltG [Candidatus Peribacteria bacterium]|nr:MAG: endolytic transglycosylase MltG [Candidatus Peribacteria bacterium]
MSTYGSLILASVIEKEEKLAVNKSPIASVFLNRLNEGMRLDADISLCYGLAKPYSACTPTVIVDNLQDANNLYNTRALAGLPPTPIGNPSLETIKALLDVKVSPYFYYLHESNGTIHLAKTLNEHNQNKQTYIQ